jgi:hypothetical protein
MKKTVIYILLGIALMTTYYLLTKKNEVTYNGRSYDLRNDEIGLMLFNENNGGEFSVDKTYKNDNNFIIKLYCFQIEKTIWVKMDDDNHMVDIDSSNYDFKNYERVNNQQLLESR